MKQDNHHTKDRFGVPEILISRWGLNVKSDHRSKFSNLSNWKEETWKKNQGFNGIRTRDHRDTGAMLYQLSYEATHWKRGQFIEFISPVRSEMVSRRSRVRIPLKPWFFQASSFQLLKLENLLRWSFFTLIYNCNSNIWIISYMLHMKIVHLNNCNLTLRHNFTHHQRACIRKWRFFLCGWTSPWG